MNMNAAPFAVVTATESGVELVAATKAEKIAKHDALFAKMTDDKNQHEVPALNPEEGSYFVTEAVICVHQVARMAKALLTPTEFKMYLAIRANNGCGSTPASMLSAKLFALDCMKAALTANFVPTL